MVATEQSFHVSLTKRRRPLWAGFPIGRRQAAHSPATPGLPLTRCFVQFRPTIKVASLCYSTPRRAVFPNTFALLLRKLPREGLRLWERPPSAPMGTSPLHRCPVE